MENKRVLPTYNVAGDGGGLRRERLHVAFVVALLHVTCLAQYAYCALFWFFDSAARPDWAVNFCMAFGLAAPVAAALYMVYGPLGRRKAVAVLPGSASTSDEEDDGCKNNNRNNRVVVAAPEWAGGLLDLGDDPTVAALSVSCTWCVFGWNMERLGMGNMYVHVFTFALLCAAPVLVFAVAALNIHDATLGYLVGASGALLSVLGLLYGGYWRAQMRRRFGLPADRSAVCGGRPALADYGKWLLCAPCALAQEVRTANLYDVEDGRLYLRQDDSGEEVSVSVSPEEETPAMAPLRREGCVAPLMAQKVDAPPVVPVIIDKMHNATRGNAARLLHASQYEQGEAVDRDEGTMEEDGEHTTDMEEDSQGRGADKAGCGDQQTEEQDDGTDVDVWYEQPRDWGHVKLGGQYGGSAHE
ncbi:hypothetical protein EJB05_30006, partial [Eragrostis curvula]